MFGGTESFDIVKKAKGAATPRLSVLDIVSADLNAYLNQGSDRQKRLNFLSRKLEIHKKTLNRISAKENSPSNATVIKLYRFLLNVDSDFKVLQLVPAPICEFLKKAFPENITENSGYSEENIKILNENPVALEIYLLAAVKTLKTSDLKKKFGAYGLNILADLVKENLLRENHPGEFTLGPRKFTFKPELVIQAGKLAVAGYAKPGSGYEIGKHFAGFYAEKLNEQAYKEWLAIDQEALAKKIELAQKPESAGTIPAFCFNIVETFDDNEVEP